MLVPVNITRRYWLAALVTIGLALVAALVGMQPALGVRHLVIACGGVACFATIWIPQRLFRPAALGLLLLTLAVGVRRAQFRGLFIHPSEVVACALLAICLLRRALRRERQALGQLGLVPALFFASLPVGFVVAITQGVVPALYAERIKTMCDGLLLLILLPALLDRERWPRQVALALGGVSVLIAVIAVAEAIFPVAMGALFGQQASAELLVANGFQRVPFAFWGGPHATFILLLALPWLLMLLGEAYAPQQRFAAYVAVCLVLSVCLLGGYRGVWLGLGCMLGGALLLGRVGALPLLALPALGILLLQPQSFLVRLGALGLGAARDSSVIDRANRLLLAWYIARDHPLLGGGWGAPGSAHSDLLQLAAEVGFGFAALFTFWVLSLLWRGVTLARNGPIELRPAARAVALSLIASLPLLAVEGLLYLPYVAVAFWLIMACGRLLPSRATRPAGVT